MTVTQGRAPVTPPRPARRAGDIVRGLCSLAALVVITGGMPAVFWFAGTILLPHGLPAPGDIGAVLTEPDDGTAFVAAALAAGWLAWAAFTLALLLEIPARLRGVSAPRLPGLRWGQQLAGGLVTGVLLLVPAGTALAQSPAAAPAITGSPATAATAPVAPEAPATVAPADVTPAEANPAPPAPVHTVRRGDSLWSIAEDRLGDPKRWPEIARLNDGRAMTDGQTFSAADHIMPGWVLILPAGARAGDPAGPAPAPAPQAPVAPQAAPAPAPDPASPDPASPETGAGTTRVTPPQTAPAGEEGTGNGTATVVVREGDTLSAIAARTLGDADRWPEIFRASTGRDQPGGARLTDPDELEIGWTLVIPAGPRTGGQPDPAPAQPAPPPGPPATQPPAPRAPEGQAPEAQSPEAQSPETRTPAPPTREPATPATGVPEPAAPSPGESVAPPAPEQPAQPPGEQGPAAAPGRDGGQAGPTAPDAAAPAPEPHGTQAAPGTGVMGAAPGASAPVSAPARAPEEPTASADDERDGIPAGVFGLAAVGAAALLGAIALRRRAQHAGRRLGRRIAMPGEDDAAAEAGLRAGEDPDALDLFDRTMRTLCARLRKENKRLPALDGGLLTPDRLSLELAAPARPPAPFVAPDGDEMRWECPAGAAILDAAAAARVPAPYPALVVLGERTDGAQVLADLESLGVVALTDGTHEDDVAVLRALAVELLANRWSEDVRITTVGFGHSLRAVARRGHGHLRRAGSLDEAFDQLASWTDEVVGLLAEAGLTSPRQARTHGVLPDTWAPEIILSAEPLAEHHIGHLRRLTTSHPRAAAAVVAPAGPEPWLSGLGVTRLPSAPGVVIPTRPRVSLVVQRLEDPQYASVVGMFRTADETDGAPAAPYETEPAYASAEFAASAPECPVSGAGDAGPARAHAGDTHDGDAHAGYVHDGGPGPGVPHGDPGDDPAGYGDPAHPGTEFAPGAGYADPANAAPAYHADPQHADSEYGDPAYRPAPGYADPGYADPGYRDPRSGDSASGDGPAGDPGYGDPAYSDPGHVLSGTSGAGAPGGGTPAGGTFGSVAPGIGAPGIGAPGIGASGSGAPHVVENEPGLPGAPAPGTGVVPAPRRAVLAPLYGGHAGGPAHPGAVVAPVAAYLTAVHEPAPATADDDTDPDTPLPYGGGVTFPDVRLLGPVELAGAGEDTGAANSARLVEIAAWIALHPGGAVTDLDAAVWPLGVSETTRNSHLARLRRGLGTGTDGRHHLPPAAGGRLSLGPGVGCDWFRFRELTACHPRQGPWAVEAYTSALALVRGEPVSGTLPRRFVWAEPWRHTMTAAVVDTAVRLGGHRFHEGELDAARAAIDVGLLVCPESQMLHRGLFRILHRQGRVDELQDRIDRLDALLAEIGLEPEAKTVRLLEILLRVKTPESGPPV